MMCGLSHRILPAVALALGLLAGPGLAQTLTGYDADGDGVMTPEEYTAYWMSRIDPSEDAAVAEEALGDHRNEVEERADAEVVGGEEG